MGVVSFLSVWLPEWISTDLFVKKSGHYVPINIQMLFAVLSVSLCRKLFISIWRKSVMPLKVKPGRKSLENGISCMFQAVGNILSQRCRASMSEHKVWSQRIRCNTEWGLLSSTIGEILLSFKKEEWVRSSDISIPRESVSSRFSLGCSRISPAQV